MRKPSIKLLACMWLSGAFATVAAIGIVSGARVQAQGRPPRFIEFLGFMGRDDNLNTPAVYRITDTGVRCYAIIYGGERPVISCIPVK